MNVRSARSVLQRAARFAREQHRQGAAIGGGVRRLDPAAVDAVLGDERQEWAPAEAAAASADANGTPRDEPTEKAGLLRALRDQLTELDDHQAQIRVLLDQVERQASCPAPR